MNPWRSRRAIASSAEHARRRSAAPPTPGPAEASFLTRYVNRGLPTAAPSGTTVSDALEFARTGTDRMAMHFYPAPTPGNVAELADAWDLHPLLREDLLAGHQRPKLERYGDVLFLVVRSARYNDTREEVDFAEFHVLLRPHANGADLSDSELVCPDCHTRAHSVRLGPEMDKERESRADLLGKLTPIEFETINVALKAA